MIIILGAGIAGLSCGYHIGIASCSILEAKSRPCGHASSHSVNGCMWDEGPHVSFTKHEYVKSLFSKSVGGALEEQCVVPINYWKGHWIEHPAQLNLYRVPQPLRAECVRSFLRTEPKTVTANYSEWLDSSFGEVFSNNFAKLYTRKYWCCEAKDLGVDWIGPRVYRPDRSELLKGAEGPTGTQRHYISTFRYPNSGGFEPFCKHLLEHCTIRYGAKVESVDLLKRYVRTKDGRRVKYDKLVNTLPLPVFLNLIRNPPKELRELSRQLRCTKLFLVNIVSEKRRRPSAPWLYVYDESMLSTRVTLTEQLSQANVPVGMCGTQVEVYKSQNASNTFNKDEITDRVIQECSEMGLVCADGVMGVSTQSVDWANVVFTLETPAILDAIWSALEPFGLNREEQDTHPLTDWTKSKPVFGDLLMAGRYGQWKYFWTDDCVLRGLEIGNALRHAAGS